MEKKLSKNIFYWAKVSAIGIVLGLSLQFVRAWTEPAVAPPGGNLGAPINTSGFGQAKAGGVILNTGGAVNGLIVQNGNVGIGATGPQKLTVAGTIELTSGGEIKFPDGTRQTTAASGAGLLTGTCRDQSCTSKCSEFARSCASTLYKRPATDGPPLNLGCNATYAHDCDNYFICLCN